MIVKLIENINLEEIRNKDESNVEIVSSEDSNEENEFSMFNKSKLKESLTMKLEENNDILKHYGFSKLESNKNNTIYSPEEKRNLSSYNLFRLYSKKKDQRSKKNDLLSFKKENFNQNSKFTKESIKVINDTIFNNATNLNNIKDSTNIKDIDSLPTINVNYYKVNNNKYYANQIIINKESPGKKYDGSISSNNLIDGQIFSEKKSSTKSNVNILENTIPTYTKINLGIKEQVSGSFKECDSIIRKATILIVDDDSYCRKTLKSVIKKTLTSLGLNEVHVLKASDGVDTINILIADQMQDNKIKLIISDENMNYLNGSDSFYILSKMFKTDKLKKIPLWIHTALEDDNQLKGLQVKSGCDLILKKQVTKSTLSEHFRKLFNLN